MSITDKELFQYWLAEMDEAGKRFVASNPDGAALLDGSIESLEVLESSLLQKYSSIADAKRASESSYIDGASRYFGEILRKQTKSAWAIEFDDKEFVYYGRPILRGGTLGGVPSCPMSAILSAIHRRTGSVLSKIVRAY